MYNPYQQSGANLPKPQLPQASSVKTAAQQMANYNKGTTAPAAVNAPVAVSAPTDQSIGAGMGTPQTSAQQPAIRGSNIFQKAGNWVEKNITSPIVEGVKDVGSTIDETITRPTTNAIGLTDTTIDPKSMPQLDPAKVKAMSDFGSAVNKQGQQFDPAKFGSDYNKPETYTPQISNNQANMPAVYQPGTPTAQIPGQTAAATSTAGQRVFAPTGQVQAPTAPGQIQPVRVPQVSGQAQATVPGVVAAPVSQPVVNAPSLQNVSGVPIGVSNVNNIANVSQEKSALSSAMTGLQGKEPLTQGYDESLRKTYVDMATSGLEQQKNDAMAQLKEQQMKSGNYGSSVGQKQMMDLQQSYDRQKIEAGQQADLMQMEASRTDRYANESADLSRLGLLSNIAGQSANTGLSAESFNRDTASMNNQVEALKADYARQGITLDNNTAMQMAQFNSQQNQQQFGNEMASAQFKSGQEQLNYGNLVNAQNTGNQLTQQQFVNEMTAKGFTAEQAQQEYQNKMSSAGFNAGQQQQGFQNQVTATGLNNQVAQQQFINEMASKGFTAEQAQQMFQNQQSQDAVRTAGEMAKYNSEMAKYSAGQEQGRYEDQLKNAAQGVNIDMKTAASDKNYNAYQDYLKNMAAYAGNQIDPQSALDAEAYARQQAEKNARLAGTIGIIGKAVGGK